MAETIASFLPRPLMPLNHASYAPSKSLRTVITHSTRHISFHQHSISANPLHVWRPHATSMAAPQPYGTSINMLTFMLSGPSVTANSSSSPSLLPFCWSNSTSGRVTLLQPSPRHHLRHPPTLLDGNGDESVGMVGGGSGTDFLSRQEQQGADATSLGHKYLPTSDDSRRVSRIFCRLHWRIVLGLRGRLA